MRGQRLARAGKPAEAFEAWNELRRRSAEHPAFTRAAVLLSELLARADFVPPYELFAEILGARGGRRDILARLGPEAADPLDEFLSLALAYESMHGASLQGFLHWLALGETEIKRDLDQRGRDEVRLMTVHGAKGLEANTVILADTTTPPGGPRDPRLLTLDNGALVWDAARGTEVIFHLAALIAIPYSYRAPASYVRANIEGTLNVMQAAREFATRRVVHTSTSETYGTAQYSPIDERHPLVGQSPYSASKIGADKIAESFHLLRPWIRSCHINELWKDSAGIYPYRELFRLFRETGYDRVTLCEVGKTPPDAATGEEILRYYKALWTELNRS